MKTTLLGIIFCITLTFQEPTYRVYAIKRNKVKLDSLTVSKSQVPYAMNKMLNVKGVFEIKTVKLK